MYMEQGNMPHVIRLVRAKAIQEEARNAKIVCAECGGEDADTLESYMVHDEVWESAGMDQHKGLLHLRCLETRLGRHLRESDFPRYVINMAILFAFERGKDE